MFSVINCAQDLTLPLIFLSLAHTEDILGRVRIFITVKTL